MPNTFTNLSFEVVTDYSTTSIPGRPEGWAENVTADGGRWALFGIRNPGPGINVADKPPFEAFKGGWDSNEDYLFEFDFDNAALDPACDPSPPPPATVTLYQACFDSALTAEGVEDFEEGWSNNEGYDFELQTPLLAPYGGLAFLESAPGPFDLTAIGGTNPFYYQTDLGGFNTIGWFGVPGREFGDPFGDGGGGITNFIGGETMEITIDDNDPVVVTFFISDQTINDVISRISAVINPLGGTVIEWTTNRLRIDAAILGSDGYLMLEGDPVTMAKLGYSAVEVANGFGSFGNKAAVTSQEIVTAINSLSTTIDTVEGFASDGSTPQTVRVGSRKRGTGTIEALPTGSGNALLGFPLNTTVGPTGISEQDYEDFESEWSAVEGYKFEFAPVDLDPGIGAQTFEDGTDWQVDSYEYLATQATVVSVSGPFDFSVNNILQLEVDVGTFPPSVSFNPIDFVDISQATAQETVDVINANWSAYLSAEVGENETVVLKRNEWGSQYALKFFSSSANNELQFPIVYTTGTGFSFGIADAASYDGLGGERFEDFEEVFIPLVSVADVSTTAPPLLTMSVPTGTFTSGEPMWFYNVGGRLPEGLLAGPLPGTGGPIEEQFYRGALSAGSNRVHVSANSSGTQMLDYIDAGVGTHYIMKDPANFWTHALSF